MKLSKLYSNQPSVFHSVDFKDGLNVILAEAHLPGDRKENTHNLGKSTLVQLLDYLLLCKKTKQFFLFRNYDLFKDFIFFLEISLDNNNYLTIRRSVKEATKISFIKHTSPKQDFSDLPLHEWHHKNIPFQKAKEILDGILNWKDLKPWPYRNLIGYLLRSQADYRNVFQLAYHHRQADWVPLIACLVGLDAEKIKLSYEKELQIKEKEAELNILRTEISRERTNLATINGLLKIAKQKEEKTRKQLDEFNFNSADKEETRELIDDIDTRIALLNERRYVLTLNKKRIEESIADHKIRFNIDRIEKVFREANILFTGQIRRDFNQLLKFHKAISEERKGYLKEDLQDTQTELKEVENNLEKLNLERFTKLQFLAEEDIFKKYKALSSEVNKFSLDVERLENERNRALFIDVKKDEILNLKNDLETLHREAEKDVKTKSEDDNSIFCEIRSNFNQIIQSVISRNGFLRVEMNKEGHLKFTSEILDEQDLTTDADRGHSFHKLLCVAFDLALLLAHSDREFPRFVFHDGVFESLDDRTKENLLTVMRDLAKEGLQPIVTVIDSDIPLRVPGDSPFFSKDEVVVTLHDNGESGRLFKMPPW